MENSVPQIPISIHLSPSYPTPRVQKKIYKSMFREEYVCMNKLPQFQNLFLYSIIPTLAYTYLVLAAQF